MRSTIPSSLFPPVDIDSTHLYSSHQWSADDSSLLAFHFPLVLASYGRACPALFPSSPTYLPVIEGPTSPSPGCSVSSLLLSPFFTPLTSLRLPLKTSETLFPPFQHFSGPPARTPTIGNVPPQVAINFLSSFPFCLPLRQHPAPLPIIFSANFVPDGNASTQKVQERVRSPLSPMSNPPRADICYLVRNDSRFPSSQYNGSAKLFSLKRSLSFPSPLENNASRCEQAF